MSTAAVMGQLAEWMLLLPAIYPVFMLCRLAYNALLS